MMIGRDFTTGQTSDGRFNFLGCAVDARSQGDSIEIVRDLVRAGEPSCVMFLNIDVLVKSDSNDKLRNLSWRSSLSLMDGMPPLMIARRKGIPLPEKVSGSDFVPNVCAMAAEEGFSVFFLGGKEGVPERAARRTRNMYRGIGKVGAYSPPFGFDKTCEGKLKVVERVRTESPDILFICLGCPKQEELVYDYLDEMGVPCVICAGATVDFLAGNIKRAPKLISKIGLEWFYRFIKEPKRLYKRYFIDSWHILKMLVNYRNNKIQ